ncbi:serine hydrolase domain-containing protein [Streptomyces sp. NPDC004111]|uniref:serine hydrolase domain-containing protein n=1 Tax=Streptomyces sp. NPDC004111 TaxID=3364690 RepID=UPI00369230EB
MGLLAALAPPAAVAVPVAGAGLGTAGGAGRWAEVDAFVRGRLDATGTPGAALAVIEGGRVVHQRGFGEDGRGRAVTPDTPFLWGSVAKPVTGLAVMQLVEAGRVRLDAPVRTYLPWFGPAGAPPAREDSGEKSTGRITVRQLLTHTSGIPASASSDVTDRFDNSPGALSRAAHDVADAAPAARPGSTYAYSSAGYAVLGALVEQVSGQPFGDYLRAKVFAPLGMRGAVATEEDFVRERVPPGHRSLFGKQVRFDAPYDTSGVPYGYAGGSLRDLTRFVRAELGGGRLDGRQVLSARGIADTQYGHVPSRTGRHGLGWSVGALGGTGERMVWKDGSLPGGYHAMVVMLPDSARAVLVLQNSYQQLRAVEFGDAAFGTARLLSGAEPGGTTPDRFALVLPWAAAGLAAVLLVLVVLSGRELLWHRSPAVRSRRRTVVVHAALVAAPLALAAALWWLPTTLGGTVPMTLLWLPDTGWSLLTGIGLALLLAVERALLGTARLRRSHG